MSFINSSFLNFTYKITTPLLTEQTAHNIYILCQQYYTNSITAIVTISENQKGHFFSMFNQ
jgi:hypothetical protein